MKHLHVTVVITVIVLIPWTDFTAGQSPSVLPSPGTQHSIPVVNHTAALPPSASSMTVQPTYLPTFLQYQTSTVAPSSALSLSRHHSSVAGSTPTPSSRDENDEDDKEEEDKKMKETAIIAASCGGGAVVIIGLILVIYSHRKNQNT